MAGAWRSLLFVALVFALGFAFLAKRISPRRAAWLLAGLMALDLWSIEHIYWMFSPRASVIYAADPIVDALKAEPQPIRVLAVPIQDTRQHDAFLAGDALMTYRIRNTFGYHGNQIGRYNELIGFSSEPSRAFSPNVLRLTNTKYILTNIPQLPLPNVVAEKGPVLNAAGDSVYLYRLGGESPYAWVTPVAVKAPDDQVLATLLNPRFDIRRASLFDTSAKVHASTGVEALPAPLSITTNVRHYEPGKVTIDLSAPAPQSASLVVSENYYPGWSATVDGKRASIGRVDYTFIGVDLPAGARSVELAFTSRAYEIGKLVTWLAIVAGLLLTAAGAWTDRRRLG